jgi:hypothetical protein
MSCATTVRCFFPFFFFWLARACHAGACLSCITDVYAQPCVCCVLMLCAVCDSAPSGEFSRGVVSEYRKEKQQLKQQRLRKWALEQQFAQHAEEEALVRYATQPRGGRKALF